MSLLTPFRSVFIFLIISLIGLAFIPKLSVNLQPNPTTPTIYISFSLPKASPEIVEQQVTAVLENALSQLTDIEHINSKSSYNYGSVTLTLNKNANLDFKKFEVASIVRQVYPKLPPETSYPEIIPQGNEDSERSPVLVYSVNAKFAASEIKQVCEDLIVPTLSVKKGIESVQISGANQQQITVQYLPERLLKYGLTVQDILQAIQRQNQVNYLGLYENKAGQRLYMKTEKKGSSLATIENLPINQSVKIKDVARTFIEEQEPNSYFRINGLTSVRLSVYTKKGENQIDLSQQVKDNVKELEAKLPKGYVLFLEYDHTEKLSEELNKIYYRTALSIGILLLLLLIVNRSWRALVVLLASIFVNLCLATIWVYSLGIQIHLYSLAGITISFGMILDNAIVMYDHLRKKGNIRVFLALLGATLTTMAALGLVFLLPEEDQYNLNDFSLIVVINLFNSLIVAWLFTPAMYQLLFKNKVQKNSLKKTSRRKVKAQQFYLKSIRFLATYRKTFNTLCLLAFGLPVFLIPNSVEGWERYNNLMNNSTFQEDIYPYIKKTLGGSLRLFVNDVYESSGYRDTERTTLYIQAAMPFGTTLTQMNDVIQEVETYLGTIKGIDKFVTDVYSGQNASIRVNFLPNYEKTSLPFVLRSRMIAKSIDWGGVGWSIFGVGEGFSNQTGGQIASFRIKTKGYNYTQLEEHAETFAQKLLKHKRIQKVNTNEKLSYNEKSAKELVLRIDRAQMQRWGVSDYQLIQTLQEKSKTLNPQAYISFQNRTMPLMLRQQTSNSFSAYQVSQQILVLNDQQSIKIDKIGKLEMQNTTNTIYKEDRQYVRVVGFDYYGGHNFGSKYLEEVLTEMKQIVPTGYSFEQLTFSWNFEKAKRQYGLLGVLLVAIFLICSILFESFRQPLVIIFTIPISFIGLFLTFAWGEFYFDQGGYAAFILLGGLVVNATIFIVNDLNQYQKGNANRNLIKAVVHKASPILMVTFSTILGLIPFLTEGDTEVFWFSLAVGTIGGLLMSLFAVFVCLPVWLYRKNK